MDRAATLAKRAALLGAKRYDDASALEMAYLAIHPTDVEFLQKAAWTSAALKQWDQAVELQARCIDNSDFNPVLHETLSKYQTAAGMPEKASDTRVNAQRLALDNMNRQRELVRKSVYAALQTALPVWSHAIDRNPAPMFSATLDAHVIDSAVGWAEGREFANRGEIVDLAGVGKFLIGDPAQVVHKRLSRGVPWELPIAVLLQELAARSDPRSVIVDVGANVGTITVPMALATKSRVIAFEPVPENFRDLVANLQLNDLQNVDVQKKACSDRPGFGEMVGIEPQNPGLAHLSESTGGAVPVVTLDDFLNGRDVSLIKMDAEGHEEKILGGATNLIARCRPLILCELLSDRAAGLQATFENLGYKGLKVFRADWLFVPEELANRSIEADNAMYVSDDKLNRNKKSRGLFSIFSRGRRGQ